MRGGIDLAVVGGGLVKDDSQVFAFGSWVDNITIFWKVEFMEVSLEMIMTCFGYVELGAYRTSSRAVQLASQSVDLKLRKILHWR